MTMSATPNVPRWMSENRRSRESYIQVYGNAKVNPATQSKGSSSAGGSRSIPMTKASGLPRGKKTS